MASEFLYVAEQLLLRHQRPMSAKELVDRGIDEGLFSDKLSGKTPAQTMKAKLSVEIRRGGRRSNFVRTAPGRFSLRRLVGAESVYDAPPLVPPMRESVMVVPTELLDEAGRFQGVRRDWRRYYNALARSGKAFEVPRAEAERRDDVKQLLTYVLVRQGNRLLAFTRGTYNRVDVMLRGARCVGFGGHVDPTDLSIFSNDDVGLWDSAVRELGEELRLPRDDLARLDTREGLELIGVINDDSSQVGVRHLAFVFAYQVSPSRSWSNPERGEQSIRQLRWIDLNEGSLPLVEYEYWSQLCLRAFFSEYVQRQAAHLVRRPTRLRPDAILVVVGRVGSGKSLAARTLVREFGYTSVNSGRVLARLMRCPPVPQTERSKFQSRAETFIQAPGGPERLAAALYEEAERYGSRVLIDGVRQEATLDALRVLGKQRGRGIGLVYVETPPDLAYRLYKKREGSDTTALEFYKLRDAPVEQQVARMIAGADAVVYNWMGASFEVAVRDVMAESGVLPG